MILTDDTATLSLRVQVCPSQDDLDLLFLNILPTLPADAVVLPSLGISLLSLFAWYEPLSMALWTEVKVLEMLLNVGVGSPLLLFLNLVMASFCFGVKD